MVYSTCSLLPSENGKQVEKFLLSSENRFELTDEKVCWPSDGFDGFYIAQIRRK
jgi:16S rRNA (cytosine967-C5)-methyltransferase